MTTYLNLTREWFYQTGSETLLCPNRGNFKMKKLPLWIRSVLRLAQWHEPDSDRSSRGRHSELPTWLLPDFLVFSDRSGNDWLMLWGMAIYIFILSKALVYILDLQVNAKSFSVSLVIIPMTSYGSKSQGLGLAAYVTEDFPAPLQSCLCYIQHFCTSTKRKKMYFFFTQMKRLKARLWRG